MTTVNLSCFAGAGAQFFDNNGIPLIGGLLYTYAAGTTTQSPTYTSSAGSTQNSNPIVLDSAGRVPNEIWLVSGTTYKFVLQNSSATQIGSWDNIPGINDLTALYASTGSSLIGYTLGATGASTTNVQAKLQQFITLKDFGAKGDGTTDDTTAFNNLIAYLNLNPGTTVSGSYGTYLLSITNTITASGISFSLDGVVFKSKQNSLSVNTSMITVSGNNFQMTGVTFDGNQSNYNSGSGCQLFLLTGSGHKIERCKFINSPGRGAILNCSESEFISCNFDYNANLGHECDASSYLNFVACTWNVNGCGFQQTRTVPTSTSQFSAFGHAIRYRSHHINFIGCEAKLNGREGFYLGEGSYSIKYHACLAWANNDGGFTINADNLGTGIPGDGEPCYTVSYVDCESYNNWSSGLVSTVSTYELSVIGGKFYNNHRCAGSITPQSAYYNGIYIAGGALGANIDCKAYDDRQTCVITSVDNSLLTQYITVSATNWVVGTINYYPVIAIYSSSGTFKGYGLLVNETAFSGSANVQFTSWLNYPSQLLYDPVSTTAGGVVAGDYITQCVQQNGVFIDNNSVGLAYVDGYGHRIGPSGANLSGYNLVSGSFNNGQNVSIKGGKPQDYELLLNPGFDTNLTNWTFNLPGGGASNRITSGTVKSAGSLQLIGGTGEADADASLITNAVNFTQGAFVEFSAWIYSTVKNTAYMTLFWNNGGTVFSTQVFHPGYSNWMNFRVSCFIPVDSSSIIARLSVSANNTAYFDNCSLRVIEMAHDNRENNPVSRYLPT